MHEGIGLLIGQNDAGIITVNLLPGIRYYAHFCDLEQRLS